MPSPSHRVPRPHSARGWIAASVVAAAVAGAAAYAAFVLLSGTTSAPAPLTIASSGSTSSGAVSATPMPPGDASGTWTIADGSVVGYRVREKLAFLSAPSDAVGRTTSVTGSATVSARGTALGVSAASFRADLSTLTSDQGMRDRRIRSIGLESATYPTASFILALPLAVPESAATGATTRVTVTGDLTIHGTTRRENIPVDIHLSGASLELAGSLTFPWSDFGMTAPNVGGFVSVTDQATMEFDLHLRHD